MDVSQGLVKHRLQVWSPVFPPPSVHKVFPGHDDGW